MNKPKFKSSKKVMAVLLSAVLAISSFGLTALAANVSEPENPSAVSEESKPEVSEESSVSEPESSEESSASEPESSEESSAISEESKPETSEESSAVPEESTPESSEESSAVSEESKPESSEEKTLVSGDFNYRLLEDGTVEIAYYTGSNKDVSIPSEIDGKAVTSIGDSAFYNQQLTNVTIPNSVTVIKAFAFSNNQLTSVIIPNSVTKIGGAAFHRNQLTNVTISNSVIKIGELAFAGNELIDVAIPDSVTSIDSFAFGSNKLMSVKIPESVQTIGRYAFGFDAKYAADPDVGVSPIDGFTITGTPNSAAHTYATENEFTFIDVNNQPTNPTPAPTTTPSPTPVVPTPAPTTVPTPNPDHKQQDFSDNETGIKLNGHFADGVNLAVVKNPAFATEGTNAAHDDIRKLQKENKLLFWFDISVTGDYSGEFELTFPVGADYNGQSLSILHYKADGTIEKQTSKVANGEIKGKFTSFSPFAIVKADEAAVQPTPAATTAPTADTISKLPQTGDSSSVVLYLLVAMVALAAMAVLIYKGRYQKRHS
ncbi:leucine-rich repeat domain-containing protein [Scatolibacter rhodanostii]|uniref:leucine-rich repeat domain-containing protein n=1 Tax=Scatolibacter rhodanostii TaxID=2014781 RepID=UPI000C06A296|nr:leucine-rich repeat domain-containing protein [Scatolibacter rhodanostii]